MVAKRPKTNVCTAVIAVPQIRENRKNKKKRKIDINSPPDDKGTRIWRVLLDSGADGDLFFKRKSGTRLPSKKRAHANRWRTSNGTFTTTRVAELDLTFPEFSERKLLHIEPDIVDLPDDSQPVYDLILGVKTLEKLGIILNFEDRNITVDKITLPMRTMESLLSPQNVWAIYNEALEPLVPKAETKRTTRILDAKYEKADLHKIVGDQCKHLPKDQQYELLELLNKYEELFDGTLGDFDTTPVSFELQPDSKPYHGRAFPVPFIHKETLKKEVKRLVELGVLREQESSEWASPTFIIPKSNQTVRFISDFREVNKRLKRNPFPIPKISTVLQELEGFQYATALDLNMGYYTIRLDPDAQKICTIILPWGKYSYLRLPMGIAGSPDIFQSRMSGLMRDLDFVRTYLDDLLIISKSSFDDHLIELEEVLTRLKQAGLRVNAAKSTFCASEIEYLGYILTRDGIKPQQRKVEAILALQPPTTVKQLRTFLGMVQYYRDLWEKRSELLAPLTDLVGECGVTKSTRKKGTKKEPWHWDTVHQVAFDRVKAIMTREVILAYPDYSELFEIYTDASTKQLGAVITQKGRPIAFFSRKLSDAQTRYSVTELELLSIVETLKEFKGMLWGQRIKVYTDHKNLITSSLGLTSDRVYRWRLLLEEYGPEIVYIKGVDNTVADAISRLEYNPTLNPDRQCFVTYHGHKESRVKDDVQLKHHPYKAVSKLLNHYNTQQIGNSEDTSLSVNDVFVQTEEDTQEIYPTTVAEIAEEQRKDRHLKSYFNLDKPKKNARFMIRVVSNTDVILDEKGRLVIPHSLQDRVIQWYHHYLQHPGMTRLEETIKATMYWEHMRASVRKHTKNCESCQKGKVNRKKYGKLPTKLAVVKPWEYLAVDLVGPYVVKGLDGTTVDFMCVTMIDPATSWFEIAEIPTHLLFNYDKKGKIIVAESFEKTSARISLLINKSWLSRYPRPMCVNYDNGSEFKLHFKYLMQDYGIKCKPTTIKNPRANAVLERVHGVLGNMMRTYDLDMAVTVNSDVVDNFLVDAAWAIRATHHTVLQATPGAAVFGRDMLFDIPFIADWSLIGKRRQIQIDKDALRQNQKRVDYDYVVGQKVLLITDGIIRKASDKYTGPFVITQVFTNGNVRIKRERIEERLHIRRIIPFNS